MNRPADKQSDVKVKYPGTLGFLAPFAIAVIGGVYLVLRFWSEASPKGIVDLELDYRSTGLPKSFRDVLEADRHVIAGFVCVLLACTISARCLAWSRGGKTMAAFGIFTTLVAGAADLVENQLLSVAVDNVEDDWRLGAAVAATIKFCALVPAIVLAIWGLGLALVRPAQWWKWWRLKLSLPSVVAGDNTPLESRQSGIQQIRQRVWGWISAAGGWVSAAWGRVWAFTNKRSSADDPIEGNAEQAHAAGKAEQRDAETAKADRPTVSVGDEQRWFNAYNVPDVDLVTAEKRRKAQLPTTAVCLSGGGVRSACVALGAMQTFADPSRGAADTAVLPEVDYVISVSGGGYTAGAFVQSVQPFHGAEARNPESLLVGRLSDAFADGSVELEHLRRRSSYIADSTGSMLKALAVVAQNLLVSLVLLFAPAVVLGVVLGGMYSKIAIPAFVPMQTQNNDKWASHPVDPAKVPESVIWTAHPASAWLAVGICAALVVLIAVLLMGRDIFIAREQPSRVDRFLQAVVNGLTGLTAVIALVVLGAPALMWLSDWLTEKLNSVTGIDPAGGAALVVLLNYIAALAIMGWRKKGSIASVIGFGKSRDKIPKAVPRGIVQLLVVLATLVILSVTWLTTVGGVAANTFESFTAGGSTRGPLVALAVAAAITVLLGLMDVTSLSLHPFYRQRLANAFAVRRVASAHGVESKPYAPGEGTRLSTYGRNTDPQGESTKRSTKSEPVGDQDGQRVDSVPAQWTRPTFVFAAAATVSGTDRPAPGLSTVSYTLSGRYIGGPDIGWAHTEKLEMASTPRIRRDLTVQAAVAVSGAAFASAMGRMNGGYQTLLAASGARLGTWLPNPTFIKESESRRLEWSIPHGVPLVRGFSYLLRELFGINPKTARLLQVTDGGHYENLGLVEALRRRCTRIYCIDASGDEPPTATTLADAMRLAEFELGVKITLDEPGPPHETYEPHPPENLAPGSGMKVEPEVAFAALNARLTKDVVITGKIRYPKASGFDDLEGQLIVAKTALWEDGGYWLRAYAMKNEVFPHDSTGDQWFDEGQFGAYTELGRLIGARAIDVSTKDERFPWSPWSTPSTDQDQ